MTNPIILNRSVCPICTQWPHRANTCSWLLEMRSSSRRLVASGISRSSWPWMIRVSAGGGAVAQLGELVGREARAKDDPRSEHILFTHYLTDLVAAVLAAPVSDETKRVIATRKRREAGPAQREGHDVSTDQIEPFRRRHRGS